MLASSRGSLLRIRNLAPDDVLPWTTEVIGWNPAQLDPRTVWIAESRGEIVGMIVAAEVHQTLLILRVLGKGGGWIRPMWRTIRLACFHRAVGAFWAIAENGHENEVRLAELVQHDDAEFAVWHPQGTFAIAGRWHAVPSRNSTDTERDRRRRNSGSDGIRTRESAWFELLDLDNRIDRSPAGAAGPADRRDPGPAEGGVRSSAAQRAGGDGRGIDGDGLQYSDGAGGGSTIRSQLYREIFGTELGRRGSD